MMITGMTKWEEQHMNLAQNAGQGTTLLDTTTALRGASAADIMSAQQHELEMFEYRQQILRWMEYRYDKSLSELLESFPSMLSTSLHDSVYLSPQPSQEDSSTIPDETNSSSPTMTKKTNSPVYKQGTLIPTGQVKASTMDVEALPTPSKSTKSKKNPDIFYHLDEATWAAPSIWEVNN